MSVTCYGVIPLQRTPKGWQCFLVQHRKEGFWGFPKGHAESNESPLEAAQRELTEETGLSVITLIAKEPLLSSYRYQEAGEWIEKTVYFYLATVSGDPTIDSKELIQGKWCLLREAKEQISFPAGKRLAQELITLLQGRS